MTLEWHVAALVLLSALLHASWNAFAKASRDPLLGIAGVTATGGAFALLALPFAPVPLREAWPFLAGSAVLHLAYQLFLVRAYRFGDLSQVYPIARGAAPLLAMALAAGTAGEVPGARQLVGITLASASIMSLSGAGGSRAFAASGVRAALTTAALIGAYTVVDGLGVRRAGTPLAYITWSFLIDSVGITSVALWLRGRDAAGGFARSDGARVLLGGVMATLGYGIVLWAMSQGAMAAVAALRETSVVFAALIGTRLLGEPFGARRVLASALLVAGLILVQS